MLGKIRRGPRGICVGHNDKHFIKKQFETFSTAILLSSSAEEDSSIAVENVSNCFFTETIIVFSPEDPIERVE